MKVFVLCSGLGHINRGFESFTREFFNHLSQEPGLDLRLFKGGGDSQGKEVRLQLIRRTHPWAGRIGRLLHRDAYVIEQLTFIVSLLPHLVRQKPDIVYFSDGNMGNMLWHWKRLTGATFKLLFSNGGPYDPPFPRWDHIQQITPFNLETGLRGGETVERQTLLPYGFAIDEKRAPLTEAARRALRERLEIPQDRPVLLSVGAISRLQKRMDYVMEEVARLPEPRPFLLLLGQAGEETPALAEYAGKLLGKEGFAIRTVPYEEVSAYYDAADFFVLGSLHEGFGRVVVEAMAQGLPCLVHDSANMRYLLGEFGHYGDFAVPGALTHCLMEIMKPGVTFDRLGQQRAAAEHFGWDQLRTGYMDMFRRCLGSGADGK